MVDYSNKFGIEVDIACILLFSVFLVINSYWVMRSLAKYLVFLEKMGMRKGSSLTKPKPK